MQLIRRPRLKTLLLLLTSMVPFIILLQLPNLMKLASFASSKRILDVRTVGSAVSQTPPSNTHVKLIWKNPVAPGISTAASVQNSATPSEKRRKSLKATQPKPKLQPPYDPSKYQLTLNQDLCSGEPIKFLVLVQSAVKNFERRAAVRTTWASPEASSSLKFRLGFVLGMSSQSSLQEKVAKEANKFRDIVQSNFTDSYYNISLSSVTALRWAVDNCASYEYLVKVDDDSFVNLMELSRYLSNLPRENSIYGFLMKGYRPNRMKNSKWYTSPQLYNKSRLPDFVSGFAYVMTSDVVPKLYAAAQKTAMFPFEDVYLTGMCRSKTSAVLRNVPRFYNHRRKNAKRCAYANVIAQHELNVTEMETLWRDIRQKRCL